MSLVHSNPSVISVSEKMTAATNVFCQHFYPEQLLGVLSINKTIIMAIIYVVFPVTLLWIPVG